MKIRVWELGLHLFHHLGPRDLGRNLPPGRSSESMARALIFRYIDQIFDLIDRIVSPSQLSNSQLLWMETYAREPSQEPTQRL